MSVAVVFLGEECCVAMVSGDVRGDEVTGVDTCTHTNTI